MLVQLPAPVIEQIAKVRLDEDIHRDFGSKNKKRFAFWILRGLNNRAVAAAAWEARHSVVKAGVNNVTTVGDVEWCAALLARPHSDRDKNRGLWEALRAPLHREMAVLLLKNGADVHFLDDDALIYACHFGNLEVVDFLLERGANIHARRDRGLRLAVGMGHEVVVGRLLAHGADPMAAIDGAHDDEGECFDNPAVRMAVVRRLRLLLPGGA